MGYHSGPIVVTDSLVFCFDAGNPRCTHTSKFGHYEGTVDVTSMFSIGPVHHSSQASLGGQSNAESKGIIGTGNTSAFSFPTDTGAATAINLGITGRNSDVDATNFDNKLTLHDNILFADQDAWSMEFWAKPNSDAEHTFMSLAGRGATNNWMIWQHGSTTWYPRYRDNNSNYYRSAGNENVSNPDDWHQVVFTADTSRNITFYVDGAAIGGSTQAADTQASVTRLMSGYSSGTSRYGFQGVMLCARIYAKTLSAAEVKQNFEATRWRVDI